jgi:hypothetical protein
MELNRKARRLVIFIALMFCVASVNAQAFWIPMRIGAGSLPDTAWGYWSAVNRSVNDTISSDSLTIRGNTVGGGRCIATIGHSSGKKYFEFTYTTENVAPQERIGMQTGIPLSSDATRLGLAVPNVSYRSSASVAYCVLYNLGAGALTTGTGCVKTVGTVIGFASNLDSSIIRVYCNGVLKATISSIPAGTWYPTFASDGSSGAGKANFGSNPWAYNPATLGLVGYTGYFR